MVLKMKMRKFTMYDKYIEGSYNKKESEEWIRNGYGEIPNLIPRIPVVDASVLNAQKYKSVLLAVVPVSIVLLSILWNIVKRGIANENAS